MHVLDIWKLDFYSMFPAVRFRFEQCSVSVLSLKGVKAAGYERMTLVQEATLPLILEG